MSLRRALVVVFVVGSAAAAFGIEVRASYGARVTADEPQYLLTALSLAEDRSLDISDEIAARRFEPFHEVQIDRQTEPLPDGSEISPHDPGLPALLAVPMELGGWRAAKGALALVNGLLAAVMLWVAVVRFRAGLGIATAIVGLFAASAPLAVYGNQVYPEIVAALFLALAIAGLTGESGGTRSSLVTACVVALPWLSVKYVPVAAAVALVEGLRLLRARRLADLGWFAGALGVAGLVFALLHLDWYGGLTPYATGDHFVDTGEFSVVGTNADPLGRSRRLVGLLVDDTFGLAVWQPLYLLGVPAVAALIGARPQGRASVVVPLVVGWLNATFVALTMQGWWWPGRQVVVVLPALVIAVCWWVTRIPRLQGAALGAGALGVISYLWLVVEGLRGRLTWVVDFFETNNPIYRVLSAITPDYLDIDVWTWVWHAVWLVLLMGAGVLAFRQTRTGEGSTPSPRETVGTAVP